MPTKSRSGDGETAATVRRRKNIQTLRRRDGLIRFASNVTSQGGEDGILRQIFHEIFLLSSEGCEEEADDGKDDKEEDGKGFKQHQRRYLVDVGAWDGKHLSNTYALLNLSEVDESVSSGLNDDGGGKPMHERDDDASRWTGILIEANEERFHQLDQRYRNHSGGTVCLCRCVSSIPRHRHGLDSILKEHGPSIDLPLDFDLLSIDVDGGDYHVLKNLLESEHGMAPVDPARDSSSPSPFTINNGRRSPGKWRPKVLCVEFNPTMPNDLVYIPPADDAVRHGASLSALVELGEQHGYVLVETTLYNAFFVRKDLYEESSRLKHLVPDPSIEALHEVTMGTSLYQLYDGTIKLHGCKKLLWHRVPIDETKIQVLPLHMRRFPYAPPGPEAFHAPTPDPSFNHVESSTPGGKKDSGGGGDDSIFDFSRVIDVSAWRRKVKEGESSSSREEKRRDSSRQLVKELKQCGFCHIRGTGISADLCRKALQVSGRFLHGADENIRRACLARDRARRGYSPPCTENFGCLVGNPSAPNDLVRKFRIGPSSSSSSSTHSSSSTSPLLQPNMWPHPTSWQDANEFRSVTEAYFEAANKAATSVVYAIAAGLVEAHPELEESLFPLFRKHQNGKSRDEETDEIRSWPGENDSIEATTTSILTLLGYTVGSRHKKGHKKGPLVAAHTDVGVLTFLLFDAGSCATLQRHHREASSVVPSARFQAAATSTSTGGASNRGSGSTTTTNATTSSEEWVNVHLPRSVPPDPVFVINVADCLSDLSGGRLPSTLHRVVANRTPPPPITNHPGHSPRTCLALFVGLHPDAPLRIQGESLSYEKWRKRRIERAVKVFKPAAAAVTASGESGDA